MKVFNDVAAAPPAVQPVEVDFERVTPVRFPRPVRGRNFRGQHIVRNEVLQLKAAIVVIAAEQGVQPVKVDDAMCSAHKSTAFDSWLNARYADFLAYVPFVFNPTLSRPKRLLE